MGGEQVLYEALSFFWQEMTLHHILVVQVKYVSKKGK